jgi:glycosyltransferase involved in cell wall biosynthesis
VTTEQNRAGQDRAGQDRAAEAAAGARLGRADGPLASVVIPIGRVDQELTIQLDALVGQRTDDQWELVLSVNSSERADRKALEVVVAARESLPARIVDSSQHRSASHARNVGAAAAEGELLLFCDGDDVAGPSWLAEMVAALAEHDAVGGHLDEDVLAVPGQEHWRPPATPDALPTFLGRPYVVSANLGVRRAAFETVGGFDTSLIRGEDIALSWDLLDHGFQLAYAPAAVIHYRHRKGLVPMLRQHYLYGRGFSQILARRGVPGDDEGSTGLRALKPNNQPMAHKSSIHYARRGAIAAGRVVGLVEQQLQQRRHGDR